MMTDGHGHTWRLGGIRCEHCGAIKFSRRSSRTCPRALVSTPEFDTDTDLDVDDAKEKP